MQITRLYATDPNIAPRRRPQPAPEPDFAGALQQTTDSLTSNSGTQEKKAPPTEQEKKAAAQARQQALRNELQSYLEKSPAEHLRDAIMKEMGVTEEELQAMPPEKREVIEADITRKMRERLLAKDESHPDATTQALATQARGTVSDGGPNSNDQSPAGMPAYTALMSAVNGKQKSA